MSFIISFHNGFEPFKRLTTILVYFPSRQSRQWTCLPKSNERYKISYTLQTQFYRNGGRCGICGDPFDGPRDNEAGGKFATAAIGATYTQGQTITIQLEITVNHGGWFEFRLCPNNDFTKRVTQECLDKYLLEQTTGGARYTLDEGRGIKTVTLKLPKDLTCSQCVLQWKWNTGRLNTTNNAVRHFQCRVSRWISCVRSAEYDTHDIHSDTRHDIWNWTTTRNT